MSGSQSNVNVLRENDLITDMDISRSNAVLEWAASETNIAKKNAGQQLRNYFNLLSRNKNHEGGLLDQVEAPPVHPTPLAKLQGVYRTKQTALNEHLATVSADFGRILQVFNTLIIEDTYNPHNPSPRHLLHNGFDDPARTIALNGMGQLLNCPGRLWVTELQHGAKKRIKGFFWGAMHVLLPMSLYVKTAASQGETPRSLTLFSKKRARLMEQFEKLSTLDEKMQWLRAKALEIQPTLDALSERLQAIEEKKQAVATDLATFLPSELYEEYAIDGPTFTGRIIPAFIAYRRAKELGDRNATYAGTVAQLFIRTVFEDSAHPARRELFEKQLETYLTLEIQAYETKRLGESFFHIQSYLEKEHETLQDKKRKLAKANESCAAAQKQEALILFQRCLALHHQLKQNGGTKEDTAAFHDLQRQLTRSLGMDRFWPWHHAWHWLSFHLLSLASTLVGGRYFKRLYAMRHRMSTGGRFSVICKLMLKKNYLRTEYNDYTKYIHEALYGTDKAAFCTSLVGYHATLLRESNEEKNHVLQEVEHVISLLNQSPFFVVKNDEGTITFSDHNDQQPMRITDERLTEKVCDLLKERERQARDNFSNLSTSFHAALYNPWTNYIGHHLLSYNGFSLKQVLGVFSGKATLKKMNRDIHDFVRFLRSLGCRQDALRLSYYLDGLQSDESGAISSEDKMAEFFSVMKNIFEQFNGTDFTVDHALKEHRAFRLQQIKNLAGMGNKHMDPCLKDRLFLNTMKKQMNRIFERYGYHERIQRTVVDGVPHYHWVDCHNTSQNKMKERTGKKWWRVIADFITIGNTVGQAAFAALASFLHGNIPLGCLILVASAAANFLLLVNAQRFAFIQLFVKGTITNGMSSTRKFIFYNALILCTISGIFVGILSAVGAVAAFTQLGMPLLFVFINAITVGTFVAIGMGSLFFFTSGQLIKEYDSKKVWNYIHSNFLFKGFLDKSTGQKAIYLLSWAANMVIIPLFFVMALFYVGASLGLGFDQSKKILQHIPKLTTAAIYAIAAVFVALGGIMYFVFGQKNFLSLGAAIAKLPSTLIKHVIHQFKEKKKIALASTQSIAPDTKISGIEIKLESDHKKADENTTKAQHMWLPYIEAEKSEKSVTQQELSFPQYDNPWALMANMKDSFTNNPEQTFAPIVGWIFYVGVIFCLLPINAFGNAKSSAEGAPTLVELLHDVGLPRLSEFIVGQLVAISCYVGSWGICGQAAHENLTETTPTLKKHPYMDDLLKRYNAHTQKEKTNPFNIEGSTIGHFFKKTGQEKPGAEDKLSDNPLSQHVPPINWQHH